MKRALFIRAAILATLLLTGIVRAQSPSDAPAPNAGAAVTDPAQVAQHFREVVARPEFQDSGDTAIDTSFEDWFSQWFKRLGDRIGNFTYAKQMPAFESLLMTILVAFSISVLLYVLVRLTRRRGGMEAEPPAGSPGPKTFRPPEFYEEEIQQALRSGDWHTAWLAAWRQFLSRLENRNLVEADRTRTNREYLAQLREKPLPASALALLNAMVDAYDRFIYGRAVISETEWDHFHRHIEEAALMLHLEDKRTTMPINRNAS